MCEGLSKISSNFTLYLIKVGKLKRFKKVSSDMKTILKTDLANLRFLSFEKGEACQSILIMLRGKIGLSKFTCLEIFLSLYGSNLANFWENLFTLR